MAKQKQRVQEVSRVDAAWALNELAHWLARESKKNDEHAGAVDRQELTYVLSSTFDQLGIKLPKQCNGEAHSNPHIDNCSVCMPNWGVVYDAIKVK